MMLLGSHGFGNVEVRPTAYDHVPLKMRAPEGRARVAAATGRLGHLACDQPPQYVDYAPTRINLALEGRRVLAEGDVGPTRGQTRASPVRGVRFLDRWFCGVDWS